MSKDWVGNAKSAFVQNGASNHSDTERQNEDYYATEPIVADFLMQIESLNHNIWGVCLWRRTPCEAFR
jgi:hypothetical protein